MITLDDVQAAAGRLAGVAHRTPVLTGRQLDEATGAARVLLKAENLQRAGAFKFRGAYNAVASLSRAERARGVATVSSGNHAGALALAARLHEVPAVILMPDDAPAGKLAATAGYGAEIVRFDRYESDREELLAALVAERGLVPIHPYDDERVMAGQGTAALELLEDAARSTSCSSASAAAACCPAARPRSRRSRPTPAWSASSPRRATTSSARSPPASASGSTSPARSPTASSSRCPASSPSRSSSALVDEVVTVSDAEIVDAMRLLFERTKTVTEPSGACAFAALLAGQVDADGPARRRDPLRRQHHRRPLRRAGGMTPRTSTSSCTARQTRPSPAGERQRAVAGRGRRGWRGAREGGDGPR